jgi:hypothetical protein
MRDIGAPDGAGSWETRLQPYGARHEKQVAGAKAHPGFELHFPLQPGKHAPRNGVPEAPGGLPNPRELAAVIRMNVRRADIPFCLV